MNALILPITWLDQAKTRQAAELTASQRKELVRAMFLDVARQLDLLAGNPLIVLVTPDLEMAESGLSRGWDIVLEARPGSESRSVDRAAALLERRGVTRALRIPADVPLVRAKDIDNLLEVPLQSPACILVPSREGTGTNALLRTPPTAFPSRFGPDSLKLHRQEALQRGVRVQIVENQRLALDLDTSGDLRWFLDEGDDYLASYRLVAGWVEKGLWKI